jgi:hypothetical protein
MATVLLTWNTASVQVPSNTDLVQYLASVDGVGQTNVAFGEPLNAQFNDVSPGTYIARVSLASADNGHVDFEKSKEFIVPETTVSLDAPDVITVEVS